MSAERIYFELAPGWIDPVLAARAQAVLGRACTDLDLHPAPVIRRDRSAQPPVRHHDS